MTGIPAPLRRGRQLLGDVRGLAAVEFAMLLPFMLLLYLGSFEITQGIAIQRMVTLTAGTVANLTAQFSSISQSSQMPDILNASSQVLTPYPATNAIVTVTCIGIDASGKATVTWSKSLHGTAKAVGTVLTIPAKLDTPNTSLIFGETSYSYAPLYDYLNTGTVAIYSSIYMVPRSATGTVTLVP
jgi:Flp pilus assembly protein TadG